MEGPIESYDQAQRAMTQIHNPDSHPATNIPFFTQASATTRHTTTPQLYTAGNMLMQPSKSILNPESEKFVAMKNRKMNKQKQREKKNVKQIIVTDKKEDYSIENVLKELGVENESSGEKKKKAKSERKKGKAKKGEAKEDNSKTPTSSSEDEDEEDEEENQSSETIETKLETVQIDEFPNSVLKTSRSTEDMFTPVIKKHSKWKNKKSMMITKDDSGHTYSSSSSASSTTSSSAVAQHATHSSSALSKPKYNLRKKSALRPSQSFDTMKSGTSSVASDDTLEAVSHNGKDLLDLAADFPPLDNQNQNEFVVPIKWVTKSESDSSNSAVIDASDEQLKIPPPPPDVTVVPQSNASQQCTPNAGLLPDIAAQAPIVMNTTHSSSSGVSSNAGDLTPPQTLMMSEPTSLEKEAVVILDDEADNCDVEFGFEVNVLDLIDAKKINHDDEAIVSFGTVLNSPESGIASSEEPNELAVKIPNYAQIVQYVAKSWKKVEQELKKGTAQKY